MANFIEVIGNLITMLVGGTIGSGSDAITVTGAIPQFINVITSNPLILMFAVLPLVGLGVGFIKRLLKVN